MARNANRKSKNSINNRDLKYFVTLIISRFYKLVSQNFKNDKMKVSLTAILLLINIISFSQTVKELEYELSYFKSGETWGNKKEKAYKLLEIDGLNAKAIDYLVEVFGRNNQKDSITILFDKIIKNNPNSPAPYLIRARERNAHFAGLTYTQEINYLKKAKELDSDNIEVIYMLGKLYYELFNNEYDNNREKENLDYYAKNSILYLSELCEQKESLKESLKFPLLQLANYLGDANKLKLFEDYKVQSSYFPISAFVDLPNDWKTDYSVNVIDFVSDSEFKVSGVESAIFHINWYAEHLKALEEPVLSDSLPTKVFRFTWLRTFNNPIAIGLENNNDSITLYWKVCDGEGGYEPGKLIENKKKQLSLNEWTLFLQRIDSLNFWKLETAENEILGTDGAQWILEGKELGRYHVVDRWSGGKIAPLCLDLLKMTDLKIKKDEIY